MARIDYRVAPGGRLRGSVEVPGDKSVSHRVVMLGAIAEGTTEAEGFLEGEDALATVAAFRAMGVEIEGPREGCIRVHGVGLHGLRPPEGPLDLGNSGTSMRLLAGLLAAQPFDTVLTGDASLRRRPMRRVTQPLQLMGARIETTPEGTAPLVIRGRRRLAGIHYPMPVASAQVKSALLLAGLYAEGRTCVVEPAPTRDHTERMLAAFGAPVRFGDGTACVEGGARLRGRRVLVPGDLSSAAFLLVGATIAPGSELELRGVGVNPTRTGVLHILRAMGAEIEVLDPREAGGEPVADLRVRHAPLRGIEIPPEWVPLAIDEFPAVFVAAACAEGETVLRGAAELRVKESDRIAAMAEALQGVGIEARPLPDGIVVRGGRIRGGSVWSHGDHRVAMAMAVAALRAEGTVLVRDCAAVATSFPGFAELAARLGLGIETVVR
ncbi:3-phosphoshikimate 1-carboxyvinyltransferase [Inmirania thermothiophila]|uniref:3-phosphoshikimate 1-carboxyvinyltransferase n=1 Tax=Inmirania thermothiophila TaxID=1750597 RepID=A0A3N1Y0G0_9GAMM|nr:3-phosphoshikimate 1-carboxyvinyltransferase [Inmirania thermothiophila]ROR32296.1 3-phosphoshikimate 1-carboxyvinyltransferase [Inmirania thermothiophila]